MLFILINVSRRIQRILINREEICVKLNSTTILITVSLFLAGVLSIGFQLINEDRSRDIASCNIASACFQDGSAVKSINSQKARLITIEDFYAAKLDNRRHLYIYLPPGYYKNPSEKYQVLYVQDGKGVFFDSDWSKESLSMHIKADELISKGRIEEIIIVGISNIGAQRSSEYAHWDGFDGIFVKGKGYLYEDFVLNDVMPFIQSNFRTKNGRENTAIMGASLGGLVSFNIGMGNPDIFSKIALQSPFLSWGEERLLEKIREENYKTQSKIKLWMDMGTSETKLLTAMRKVIDELLAQGYRPNEDLAVLEVPGGEHRESSWAERIEDILIYFYGNTGKP